MHDGRCYLQWPSCISFVVYDCYMAALAHNVLQMVRRLRRGVGLPGSVVPGGVIAAKVGQPRTMRSPISARCHGALRK